MLQVMLWMHRCGERDSRGCYELGIFTVFSFVYRTLEFVIHYIIVLFKFWRTGFYFKFSRVWE